MFNAACICLIQADACKSNLSNENWHASWYKKYRPHHKKKPGSGQAARRQIKVTLTGRASMLH
jgi:hypothetical protein